MPLHLPKPERPEAGGIIDTLLEIVLITALVGAVVLVLMSSGGGM